MIRYFFFILFLGTIFAWVGLAAFAQGSDPRTEAKIDQLEEQIRKLKGQLEDAEHQYQQLSEKLDVMAKDMEYRFKKLETHQPSKESLIVTPENKESVSQAPLSNIEDAGGKYEKALRLIRAKKYEESAQAFKTFLAGHPQHHLASNAYYWLGESYYAQGKYDQAAVQFLKGYQDFPKGHKRQDNLLKLAKALKHLEKNKEACATLDKFMEEFSAEKNEVVTKAKEEQKALGC